MDLIEGIASDETSLKIREKKTSSKELAARCLMSHGREVS
jgi:hypothetical protein